MKTAVIPLKGFDGKSRLGVAQGGPFDDCSRRFFIEAMLEDLVRAVRESEVFDQTLIAIPAVAGDAIESCKDYGYSVLPLYSSSTNDCFGELQFRLREHDRMLSLASDLPLVTASYLQHLDSQLNQLTARYGKGVVINCSRGLGSATIYLDPPDVYPITLDVGRHNLLIQLAILRQRSCPVVITSLANGIFDIDWPDDLREVFYLLRESSVATSSKTLAFLARHKWKFLLSSEYIQTEVADVCSQLLGSSSDSQINELIQRGLTILGPCAILARHDDNEVTIYVSPADLMNELLWELTQGELSVSATYSMMRPRGITWKDQQYTVRLVGYGVMN